jgi:carbonic anhydrase
VSPGPSAQPSRRLAIVTCMDCRIDPLSGFGIAVGEAHVLRNAGGAVTDDVIRSLAISQRKLGTREVMVVRHTGCGMAGLDADAFTAELAADAGVAPPFAIEAFGDLEAAVRDAVRRVRESPFVPFTDAVSGWVYDIDAGALRPVAG